MRRKKGKRRRSLTDPEAFKKEAGNPSEVMLLKPGEKCELT